ncbi:hypothetical protein G5I_12311 [Acromyrmex echinatior]|uniref:Uncharacterized protein n=1 Tax=Acromyrmex echinatior TaxID=103372 RepID=F4X1Z2_ACREC|nr:hypothetical protein G5I_12311 [Acromyrmex echinatior]
MTGLVPSANMELKLSIYLKLTMGYDFVVFSGIVAFAEAKCRTFDLTDITLRLMQLYRTREHRAYNGACGEVLDDSVSKKTANIRLLEEQLRRYNGQVAETKTKNIANACLEFSRPEYLKTRRFWVSMKFEYHRKALGFVDSRRDTRRGRFLNC